MRLIYQQSKKKSKAKNKDKGTVYKDKGTVHLSFLEKHSILKVILL